MVKVSRENGETGIVYDETNRIVGLANYVEGEAVSAYLYKYDKRGNIVREEVRIIQEEETIDQIYTYVMMVCHS